MKVMLFQLWVCSNPHDNATHNFFPYSESFTSGLSIEISFVPGLMQGLWLKQSKFFPENGMPV